MAKKVQLKTGRTSASVSAFIESIEDEGLKRDSRKLLQIFKKVTGMKPKMWGPSIVGFGEYTYHRANGDEGTYMATGFSPRKSGPTIYIMPGYEEYSAFLNTLGKHKLGKSCLYLKSLEDVDTSVLEQLILQGLKDLKQSHQTNY